MSDKSVALWLQSLNLGDLASKFKAEGFDNMARISALTNEDLENMGVKRGYRSEILRAAASLAPPTATPTVMSSAPSLPAPTEKAPPTSRHDVDDVEGIMDKLRQSLYEHGAHGIVSIGRKFRIIDDDNSNSLSLEEFKKCMIEHTMNLTELEIRHIFNYFDADGSGTISYDEFLVGIRGKLNERRKALVAMAFNVIDIDKSGTLDITDIVSTYDASKHPDVLAGKKTKNQIFREFLDTFDTHHSGVVSLTEFERYYANISASIDDDDYFELMIRNAWHISGGKGQYENTTCRRVLVTHKDGHQSVEEITNDIGIGKDDQKAMIANLKARGIEAAKIATVGTTDDETKPSSPSKSLASSAPSKSSPSKNYSGQSTKSSIIFG